MCSVDLHKKPTVTTAGPFRNLLSHDPKLLFLSKALVILV